MSNKSSSDLIGPKLLAALGLPSDRCRKAVITIAAGEAVLVEAEYYAEFDADHFGDVVIVAKRLKIY